MMQILIVVVMSLVGLAASHERHVGLVAGSDERHLQIESEDCETSYFNFFIEVEGVSDTCNDSEAMGNLTQEVIDKVRAKIPEYQDEFMEANVCPLPMEVRSRTLRSSNMHRMLGTYALGGGGKCYRCRRNRRKRAQNQGRRDLMENPAEVVCAKMKLAEHDAILAEGACVAGEAMLEELTNMADETIDAREENEGTRKLTKGTSTKSTKKLTKGVKDGAEGMDSDEMEAFARIRQILEECNTTKERIRAGAKIAADVCKEAQQSVMDNEPYEYQLKFVTVAGTLQETSYSDRLSTQGDYHKVKDQKIELKTKFIKEKFQLKKSEIEEHEKILLVKLEEDVNQLELDMKGIEEKKSLARKRKDHDEEERLTQAMEALEDIEQELKDELDAVLEHQAQAFKHDYDFAMGALDVEAADTLLDWYKEFGDLIEMVLPERLHDGISSCFDKVPGVNVKVVDLADDEEQKLDEEDCPAA